MNRKREIRRFSDLPYFKEEYTEILAEMGIHHIEDLLDALYEEEMAEQIAARLKGVGPRIISQWTELIEDHGVFDEAPEEEPEAPAVEEAEIEEIEEEAEIEEIEEEAEIEEIEEEAEIEEIEEEAEIEEIEEEAEIEEIEEEAEEEGVIIEEAEEEQEGESEVLEEGAYVASLKPELDEGTRALLRLRRERDSERPRFRRQEWFRYKKLGEKWRKPKGIHSKMRRHLGYRPPVVSVGYRGPEKVRGLHPSGFEEVLVHNSDQLEGLNPGTQAIRIGSTVGYRKRLEIESKADELGIRVLNRTG